MCATNENFLLSVDRWRLVVSAHAMAASAQQPAETADSGQGPAVHSLQGLHAGGQQADSRDVQVAPRGRRLRRHGRRRAAGHRAGRSRGARAVEGHRQVHASHRRHRGDGALRADEPARAEDGQQDHRPLVQHHHLRSVHEGAHSGRDAGHRCDGRRQSRAASGRRTSWPGRSSGWSAWSPSGGLADTDEIIYHKVPVWFRRLARGIRPGPQRARIGQPAGDRRRRPRPPGRRRRCRWRRRRGRSRASEPRRWRRRRCRSSTTSRASATSRRRGTIPGRRSPGDRSWEARGLGTRGRTGSWELGLEAEGGAG